jgi:hydrogenase nickel incorporation protein HypB
MCRTCGCDDRDHSHSAHDHPWRRVALETDLLARNDRHAEALRARFDHDGTAVLNLIGAPGAGKTTLLEHTLPRLGDIATAVVEGDQATDHDARRIAATGCRVVQVNTGAGCHLEAPMIERALGELKLGPKSLLFVENVGNLVCPALFDLGERAKVVVVAITEGDDKPLKYPHIYRAADAMVVTKIDLAPHVDSDPWRLIENARRVNPKLVVFPVTAKEGYGLEEWCGWLRGQLGVRR